MASNYDTSRVQGHPLQPPDCDGAAALAAPSWRAVLRSFRPQSRGEGAARFCVSFILVPALLLAVGLVADELTRGTPWFWHAPVCLGAGFAIAPFVFIAVSWPTSGEQGAPASEGSLSGSVDNVLDARERRAVNKYFFVWESFVFVLFFVSMNLFIFNSVATADPQSFGFVEASREMLTRDSFRDNIHTRCAGRPRPTAFCIFYHPCLS